MWSKPSRIRRTQRLAERRASAIAGCAPGLVIAELALSMVLLTSALELTRSAVSLNGMDRGVDAERVMTAQLSLNGPASSGSDAAYTVCRHHRGPLTASTAAIDSASVVNYPPLSIIGTGPPIAIEGHVVEAGKEPHAQSWVVAPRYFATLGIPMLTGRDSIAPTPPIASASPSSAVGSRCDSGTYGRDRRTRDGAIAAK